jgi:cytochrome b561
MKSKKELNNKYTLGVRLFHWVSAFFVITLLTVGFIMADMQPSPEKWQLYFMHKSFGLLFFIIVLLRIFNRYRSNIPQMPKGISSLEQKAAKIGHYMMYIIMFVIPFAGILMSVYAGKGLPFFITTFFEDVPKNPQISSIFWLLHVNLPLLLIAVITLHVIGSFKHLLVDKINIFKRII